MIRGRQTCAIVHVHFFFRVVMRAAQSRPGQVTRPATAAVGLRVQKCAAYGGPMQRLQKYMYN